MWETGRRQWQPRSGDDLELPVDDECSGSDGKFLSGAGDDFRGCDRTYCKYIRRRTRRCIFGEGSVSGDGLFYHGRKITINN